METSVFELVTSGVSWDWPKRMYSWLWRFCNCRGRRWFRPEQLTFHIGWWVVVKPSFRGMKINTRRIKRTGWVVRTFFEAHLDFAWLLWILMAFFGSKQTSRMAARWTKELDAGQNTWRCCHGIVSTIWRRVEYHPFLVISWEWLQGLGFTTVRRKHYETIWNPWNSRIFKFTTFKHYGYL